MATHRPWRRFGYTLLLACTAAVASAKARTASPIVVGWTATFVGETDFAPTGRTPYFTLEPGYVIIMEGTEDGEHVVDVQTVLSETRLIDGVTVGVVEDRESKDGKLAELTLDYYAISKRTNSVYYFGEDVDEYKDGKVAGHGGSWRSGVNGAKFGLVMPGLPLLGARYFQEVAPGIGMDQGTIVSVDDTLATPAETFAHCVKTSDTSALEPGTTEEKLYAPGIGVVRDGALTVTKHGFLNNKGGSR